jgi:hypothetical protein
MNALTELLSGSHTHTLIPSNGFIAFRFWRIYGVIGMMAEDGEDE